MHYWNQDIEWQDNTQPARDSERSPHTLDQEKSSLSGTAEAPIGVFDSGVGGLTILSTLREELPHENYVYFGDTANCPYGMRSDTEIIELSRQACHFLIEQGVKLIVVACNTASQAALNSLRAFFPSIRFVGVVPAVKPAARATKKGRIGIAATNQAAKAIYLQQLIDEFAGGIQAFAVGCPELVTLVEQGEIDSLAVEEAVKQALDPILKEDVDVIVLGCTHFPALRPVIDRVTQHKIRIIDSSNAVARRTHYVLDAEGLIQPDNSNNAHIGNLKVWCSGDAEVFSNVANKLLGYSINVQQARL
jgi:glutamate racemase